MLQKPDNFKSYRHWICAGRASELPRSWVSRRPSNPRRCADRLIEVLTSINEPDLFLSFPGRAAMAPKLRAFTDSAKAVAWRTPATTGAVSDWAASLSHERQPAQKALRLHGIP